MDNLLDKLTVQLIISHMRWEEIKENGNSDPFWPDGASMNLVRNHIIFYKKNKTL